MGEAGTDAVRRDDADVEIRLITHSPQIDQTVDRFMNRPGTNYLLVRSAKNMRKFSRSSSVRSLPREPQAIRYKQTS